MWKKSFLYPPLANPQPPELLAGRYSLRSTVRRSRPSCSALFRGKNRRLFRSRRQPRSAVARTRPSAPLVRP